MTVQFKDHMLPIQHRGNFRNDVFFKDFQNDFESAMQNVMSRFGGQSLIADRLSNLRSLRTEIPTNDANVASISDNKDNYVVSWKYISLLHGGFLFEIGRT